MRKLKLSAQINFIFSTVTILACLIFVFVLNLAFTTAYFNQNRIQLENFFDEVYIRFEVSPTDLFDTTIDSEFNDFIIFKNLGEDVTFSRNFLNNQTTNTLVNRWVQTYVVDQEVPEEGYMDIPFTSFGGLVFLGRVTWIDASQSVSIFVVSDFDAYMSAMSGNIPLITSIAFINILVLGYIIIWIWSSSTVKKLKVLQSSVEKMVNDNYQTPIQVEGSDEIAELAKSIDEMREAIKENEETKKEILQNIGHDLKTPIAVIRSYAEAIEDGISNPEDAKIIINQADVLSYRIKQLVELTKIEHLEISQPLEEVSMKTTILRVVDHYKYLTSAKFELDLDDSTHPMIEENFYIAISNIIDNAIRYVKSVIRITLKNKKITIYNDGENIKSDFISKIFNAYEKSSKGQFGLGMAISKTTLNRFGLQISASNVKDGVLFTIEPI